MASEPNKLCSVGFDLGAPGGDYSVVVEVIRQGRAYALGTVERINLPARRAGKSCLAKWVRVWNRKTYANRIHKERAELARKMIGRPTAARLRRLEKLRRYCALSFYGRGRP